MIERGKATKGTTKGIPSAGTYDQHNGSKTPATQLGVRNAGLNYERDWNGYNGPII